MPITIHKLSTQCRVSLRCRPLADVADRLARNRLVGELSQLLGPALSRQDPVIRIRRLSVKLRLGTHDFTEDLLPSAWARAVAKSLFEALGRSANGSSEDVVRYPSLVHFHAAYIRDLLAGRSHGRWEYAEFEPLQ